MIQNKNYDYLEDILEPISRGEKVGLVEINELGGRYSSKTYTGLDFLIWCSLLVPKGRKLLGIGVRNNVGDSVELWEDAVEHAEEILEEQMDKVKINISKKRMLINGNALRILGLKTNKKGRIVKTGLKRLKGGDYVVLVIDEAAEIDKDDYQALMEAVSDAKSVIIYRTSNPTSRSAYYVDYCIKHMKHNVKELKNEETGGQQFKVVHKETMIRGKWIPSTHVFHYTNWRTNKEYLSDTTIMQILNTWNVDPYRARWVDYGEPLVTSGAIYARLMDKLLPYDPKERDLWTYYWIGIDFGEADPTVAIYGSSTDNNEVIGWLDEYFHDNQSGVYKDSRTTAIEIVAKIRGFLNENPKARLTGIDLYVETSAPAYIVIVKEEVRKQGLISIVSVRGCIKPPILDRINAVTLVMGQQRVLAFFNKIPNLLRELDLAEWDKEASKPTRLDFNDHALNALEYGLSRIMYRMIERYNVISYV